MNKEKTIDLINKYEDEDNPIIALQICDQYLTEHPADPAITDKKQKLEQILAHLKNYDAYKKTYEKSASLMTFWYDKEIEKRERFQWAVKQLQSKKIRKVLDIGCFRGEITMALGRLGFEATGIEISSKNVKFANKLNKNPKIKFIAGFAEESDKLVPKNHFEAALLFEILEHVIDVNTVLDAAEKAIIPGGYILISLPGEAQSEEAKYHKKIEKNILLRLLTRSRRSFREHVRCFDEKEICSIFGQKNNFSMETIKDSNGRINCYFISYQTA
ncbi:MAG: class I SAM-dependent methyltransferase [bacterium]